MRRVLAIASVLIVAAIVVVLATGVGSGHGGYQVRAIFDSAFGVIPGEEVKVAGVEVGTVDSLHVTDDKRAAVVLDIDKAGFGDFRSDATCTIRPQSLIGEKYVECTPTQPRAQDAKAPPPLPEITSGDGKGQHLLPVANTRTSVDPDLIADIYQLPERQRLTIILDELGTGLAGRGKDLNDVIRRADPALMQTDQVLAILKQQNQVLADLATQSDQVLAPLAKRKQQVADFVTQARNVSQATAAKSGPLAENLRKLPGFLSQLRPTLTQLGDLSDQMTPVLSDLGAQSGNINRLIEQTGPLASSAQPAIKTLGQAAAVGTPAVKAIRPVTSDLNDLATTAEPLAANLDDLLVSLRDTGGIEGLMDYLFFQASSINGFDSQGHYLRAALLINTCSTYAVEKTVGCEATFSRAGETSSLRSAASDPGRSLYLKRQDALMSGMSLEDVLRDYPASGATTSATPPVTPAAQRRTKQAASAPIALPAAILPNGGSAAPVPATPKASAPAAAGSATTDRLLDYLLGSG